MRPTSSRQISLMTTPPMIDFEKSYKKGAEFNQGFGISSKFVNMDIPSVSKKV
jgi:hypothetical protein